MTTLEAVTRSREDTGFICRRDFNILTDMALLKDPAHYNSSDSSSQSIWSIVSSAVRWTLQHVSTGDEMRN